MIKLQISGRHFETDDKILAYVDKKIGGLDRYMPRSHQPIMGTVVLEFDASNRQDNQYCCEVILNVPGEVMQAKEGTVNMFAAVDIVEQKIKAQVLKYKDKHEPARNKRKMMFGKILSHQPAESSTDITQK